MSSGNKSAADTVSIFNTICDTALLFCPISFAEQLVSNFSTIVVEDKDHSDNVQKRHAWEGGLGLHRTEARFLLCSKQMFAHCQLKTEDTELKSRP